MPQYQISVPGQGTFRVDSPTELTDLQAWQAVQSQLAAGPSKERTFGEAAKDIAAGVVSGAGSLVQLPGQLYGLATGDFSETGALGLGKDIAKYGEEMKSAGLKAREAARAEKIKAAEQTGQWEAFKTAFGETIKDPALLTSFLAEQAPQLLVPFGAAKVAQIGTAAKAAAAAQGLVGEAATKAAGEVTKAAAERGARAAIGAAAVQQGADVGAQAYEDIYKELKSKGATDADAAQGALNLARAAGASGALISVLAQRLPGARTLEESFAGVPGTGGRLLGALKGAAGEGISEVVEETGGKFGANLAMREVKPEQSLLEGLGQTAGMAAIGGVGMGGVSGLARRPAPKPEVAPPVQAPPPIEPPVQPPTAPVGALEYKPEPFIQFPDGTVAKRSEVEAYIKTLPEDQQMAMRAKLLGLAPQEGEKAPETPTAALEFKPEPLIVYPDGSVAKRSEVDAYIQGLPEDQQIPARAKLLGMGEEATQVTPEMLRKLGIRGRAPIIQRLTGLELTDPKVAEELTNFAQQPFASPEVRGNIFGFLNTIKPTETPAPAAPKVPVAPPVAPPPVSEAPTPVAPPVEPPVPPVTPPAPPAPFAAPGGFVSSVTLSPAYEGVEPLSVEDADFELEALQNSAEKGRLTPEQFAGSEIGKRLDTAQIAFINEGLRADPVGTITVLRNRLKQATAAPAAVETTAPVAEKAAPKAGDFVKLTVPGVGGPVGRAGKVEQILPSGDVEVRTQQGEIVSKPAGEVTVVTPAAQKAEAPVVEIAEPLATRKEAQTFGKAIGAAQPYPGELKGRVNLPAQKAAKEGNFQGVLSALEKSKNVIVAEIAKRARALGTKIVIDDDAEETYTGPSTLMRQMSIDGAKMHLEALNKIRALAPQVDALPDKAELSYAIRGETINAIDGGESAGRMYLEDIAKMGHSMFAPLPIGESKFKTKEDFKRLQKAYEDLTAEYGENALQLTSTGSAQITGVAGVYDADTDTIRVPEYNSRREDVLAHEIVHAQTVQAIANPSLRQKPIVARLNKLYEHVKKELEGGPGRAPYGIQSIQEFVAEGMGNPAFQFLLKKIKYENTSAWDSFVQTIANLIGVKRDTAFTELLSIYSDLTTEQKAEPKAEVSAVKAPTEKPAAKAPAAPPVLDTTGIKEVKGRHPQVQAAAKLLQDKKMTREEFEKYVDYYRPIEEIEAEKLLPPTSEQRMNETVNADKRDKINVPVADGTKVGLRMDLPARERGGSVVSIHEGKPGKLTVGKLMGFRSTGWLKDVTFEVRSQEKGLAVATGAAKAPQQTVEGTWFNLGPEETYARVKELMKDPAWTQVGFDPSRHGYFYDRKTREPVVSASEMYQVGQFLLAKDVKYAPKENYLYSIEPTIKSDRLPSYKRGVENLRKRWDKGELTSDEFAARVDILARQIETAELTRALPARERGADYIRQRLLEAKRRGELTAEAVDFAEWFILQNPKLVDDLAISIRSPKEGGVAGSYESVRRLMTLMKDNSSDYTAVHEILHHLERMMPKDVQSAIRKVWFKSLVEAQKKAKTEAEKTFFENIMEYHFGMGGNTYLKNALDAIKNGNVDKSFYQYSSPSEFWAENGSEIMGNRFLMQGSVLKKLKQWLREVAEKAKDLFGLNSKAPIIRALDSLSKGDGKFVTSTMLEETTEPKLSVTEKVTAAAQKALQKQPMPEKGLSHVSPELTNLAQPIFFPQNKTIIDRIEGMKDRFWQRLAQKTADQFRTIKEYSPTGYMQARLSKSIDGSLEGLLFHGQVFDDGGALNIKPNTKGMMDILKPIGNELDSYLMWVALNRESTLPDTKRSKIPNMDKLVARRAEFAAGELNGKPRVEVYQDVLKQMNQLNKSVLDIALAKGIINQEGYDKFSNDIYYIPFYKKMEEDGTTAGAQTASGLTSQYFSKELKGSEAPFGDLMENIVRNWSHILSASMKNAAAQTTINDAMKLQAAEPNLKAGLEMRDGVVYSTKSDKPIEAKFDEDGKQIYAEGELRPDLTTSGTGMAKIMVDGQPMYFKVTDELLMDSISSIGYLGPKSKFLDVARNFKNMLQYGVTASPIFKVNNLIRDSISALAVSDLKKSPVYNVMTGISLSKKDSPTYISALAGGGIFNFGSAYEGDQAKLIKRLLDQGVDGDTILDTKEKITKALKKTWEAYQHLGDRSEAANRLALYQQMREKGMSHLQASFMARDLLDFSMQGSWPAFRLITQVVPFMNARIQGLYKLGRDGINPTVRVLYNATTGKEIDANDKVRFAQFSTVTAAVMLASAMLYLSFKDDEDFKKRDAWDRDNFWWFKIPSLDIAFRVPKPFEVGAFGTLVERSLEQIYDQGAEGKTFGDSLKRTLWDTFSLNPTPQFIKPLVDIYANKDSFSGAPIESAGLERLSKQERMTEQTSPLAIALSKVWSTVMPEKVESSPVQVDYAIKGYFGWMGAMASMASTYAVMPFKEGEYPDARWLDRASLGLVRDLPAPQSAYVTAFYENAKEISQAYADMRHYREMGDAEKVQEILEKNGDKIALAKFYDKTSKNIANVRKQIQFITNDKTLDGATKKEEIERMKLIMSDLAKQAEEVRKSMKP